MRGGNWVSRGGVYSKKIHLLACTYLQRSRQASKQPRQYRAFEALLLWKNPHWFWKSSYSRGWHSSSCTYLKWFTQLVSSQWLQRYIVNATFKSRIYTYKGAKALKMNTLLYLSLNYEGSYGARPALIVWQTKSVNWKIFEIWPTRVVTCFEDDFAPSKEFFGPFPF